MIAEFISRSLSLQDTRAPSGQDLVGPRGEENDVLSHCRVPEFGQGLSRPGVLMEVELRAVHRCSLPGAAGRNQMLLNLSMCSLLHGAPQPPALWHQETLGVSFPH